MNGKKQQMEQEQLTMSEFLPETCTAGLMLGNNGQNK